VPPLAFRHRSRPTLGDQHVRVVGIQRQPISYIVPIEIDPVDGVCQLAREYDGFDLIGVLIPNAPFGLRIRRRTRFF
jgi:hypothetical protein